MDLQVDNKKLKHLVELESRESILLNNLRAEIARIKEYLSKDEVVLTSERYVTGNNLYAVGVAWGFKS